MKRFLLVCFTICGVPTGQATLEGDRSLKSGGGKGKCSTKPGFDRTRDPFECPNFLCKVFADYYAVWHCKNEACSGLVDGEYEDPSIDLPVYGCLGEGVCLLRDFHKEICPTEKIGCNCDQNFMFNVEQQSCNSINLDTNGSGQTTDLVKYCEALTGLTWVTNPKSNPAQAACLQGCTRYFAAEGYNCCNVDCNCGPLKVECPVRTCCMHEVFCG